MTDFHPYFTHDGSVGLYSPQFNDIYHSATGALTEAYEKFIYPSDIENLMTKESIKVLDICYGIGYNSKSFLNYILENFCQKNFSKNSFSTNSHIASIDTDKIGKGNITNYIGKVYDDNISANSVDKISSKSNQCNVSIHGDKVLPKIYIKAVDFDKFLSQLSPFIKTGVKKIDNSHLDFEYSIINKFLNSDTKIKYKKINNLINYLILSKIIEKSPEILENKDLISVLDNQKYNRFLDDKIISLFEYYRFKMSKNTSKLHFRSFLHNIYYKYVSKGYKSGLKRYNLQDVEFELKNDDARNVIINDNNLYDLIFLDAFTPSKCPCLWSYDFFKLLFEHLETDGKILTYTTSASVRGAMAEAGFFIGNIYNEREKKFTGTIATKNKSLIKYPLSEFDLGLLKTKAGIFYRDENLTALNEAILVRRNEDVKNSTRMSTSKYRKQAIGEFNSSVIK